MLNTRPNVEVLGPQTTIAAYSKEIVLKHKKLDSSTSLHCSILYVIISGLQYGLLKNGKNSAIIYLRKNPSKAKIKIFFP